MLKSAGFLGKKWTIILWGVLGLTACGAFEFQSPIVPTTGESLPAESEPVSIEPVLEPTPLPNIELIPYLNPDLGVALQIPAGWAVQESPFLQFASDEALFDSTDGVSDGALIGINAIGLPPDADLAQTLTDQLSGSDGLRIIEEPTNETLNEQKFSTAKVISIDESGTEFVVRYSLIQNGEATLFVSGVTPNFEAYEAVLEDVARSVVVSEAADMPDIEAPSSGGSPSQYTDPDQRFTFTVPAGWELDANDPDAVIVASSNALIIDNIFQEGGATVWFFPNETTTAAPDPVVLLGTFISNFPIYDGFNIEVEPTFEVIAGQAGAYSRYSATFQGFPVVADYYVVTEGEVFVIAVSLASVETAETDRAITAEIVQSIDVR